MASSSGLTYSPQALDPYQVETTLAKEAYEGAGNASQQRLLDSYWYERQANKNVYGQEVEANRQLQQAQMQNALREKYLALYKDADPGLIDVINQQGGFYGADPGNMYTWAAQKAEADRHSKLGSAASSYSTAGMGPEALTTNLGIAGFGMRPDMQIAQMREAGANARASAAGHREGGSDIEVAGTETGAIDQVTGRPVRAKFKSYPGESDASIQARSDDLRRRVKAAQLEPSGVAGVSASQGALGSGQGNTGMAGPPSGGTRLGPNPNAGKPAAKTPPPAAQTQTGGGSGAFAPGTKLSADKQSQQRARAGLGTLPKSYTDAYNAAMPGHGNNIPVAMHNGKLHYVAPDRSVGPAVP